VICLIKCYLVTLLQVVTAPAATLYLTLWASDEVTTHFGKTEGADERCVTPAARPAALQGRGCFIHACWPCRRREQCEPCSSLVMGHETLQQPA